MSKRREYAKRLLKHYFQLAAERDLDQDNMSEIEGIVDEIMDTVKSEMREPQTVVTMGMSEYEQLRNAADRLRSLESELAGMSEYTGYQENNDVLSVNISLSRKKLEDFLIHHIDGIEDNVANEFSRENINIEWLD